MTSPEAEQTAADLAALVISTATELRETTRVTAEELKTSTEAIAVDVKSTAEHVAAALQASSARNEQLTPLMLLGMDTVSKAVESLSAAAVELAAQSQEEVTILRRRTPFFWAIFISLVILACCVLAGGVLMYSNGVAQREQLTQLQIRQECVVRAAAGGFRTPDAAAAYYSTCVAGER